MLRSIHLILQIGCFLPGSKPQSDAPIYLSSLNSPLMSVLHFPKDIEKEFGMDIIAQVDDEVTNDFSDRSPEVNR